MTNPTSQMIAALLAQQGQQPPQPDANAPPPDATAPAPPSPLAMQQAMAMSKQGGPGIAGGMAGGLQGMLAMPGMREQLAKALQSAKPGQPPPPGAGSAPAMPGMMAE